MQVGDPSARGALNAGGYDEAERTAASHLADAQQRFGRDSAAAAAAMDLLLEALLKGGKGGSGSTLELAAEAVALKTRQFGPNHTATADSLHYLGLARLERGEFKDALLVLEKALAIRRAAGPARAAIAESLEGVAMALIRLERFRDATQSLEEARQIYDDPAIADVSARADLLGLFALLHRYEGRYPLARDRLDQALRLYRSAPEDPGILPNLQLHGELLFLTGNVLEARATFGDLLEQSQRSLGAAHSSLARTLRWRALTSSAVGDFTEARSLLEHALPIADKGLARCHPETTGLLNDLGSLLTLNGEYTQAESVYQRALVIRQDCLGRNHSLTATLVHNLALLAGEMGDLSRAERLHNDAIKTWTSVLGADHPYVGRGLDAVAEVLLVQGRTANARNAYERALAIRQKRFGPTNPDVAWTLTNLARAAVAGRDLTVGRQRVEEALSIFKQGGLPQEPDHLSRALTLLGSIQMQQGEIQAARAVFSEALATRERMFGAAHPLSAESRRDTATADFVGGSFEAALRAALDAEASGRAHLQFTIRYLPERQAMAYADKRPRGLDLALSIVASERTVDPAAVFDAVIRSRSVILDELIARTRSTSQPERESAALNTALVAARQRFANLMLRSLQGQETVPQTLLDQARQDREEAERALAARSAVTRAELAQANIGLGGVRGALPADAALVSFIRYDRVSVVNRSAGTTEVTPSYIAFVMRSGVRDVAVVPLGSAEVLERSIAAWQKEVRGGSLASGAARAEQAYRRVGLELRRNSWDKMAPALGEAARVFIVADGAVNLVNFAALPAEGDRYLVDVGPVIHYLSAERDVLPVDIPSAARSLLAVGGAAFDGVDPQRRTPDVRRSGCQSVATLRFNDLPGSMAEVRDIAALWSADLRGASEGKSDLTVLTGTGAGERSVKEALSGHRIVHLATHGFFLGSECETRPANTRAVGGVVSASAPSTGTSPSVRPQMPLDNPLLLSGLALAGANRRASAAAGQDDGILTAEEIAGFNLNGTEWAVLSACDTGIGAIKSGEGVFGLRRAFQIAGARTVIMSLWSVEDQSARDWMRALYTGRLQKGLSTSDAVREASLEMLRERRAKRLSTHPFYWAAFIAAGDWS